MTARIFVAKLSPESDENELRQFFSTVGKVTSVTLPLDRQTGRRRGFAFIDFEDAASAQEAIRSLNQQQLRGRSIVVTEAQQRQEGGRHNAGRTPAHPLESPHRFSGVSSPKSRTEDRRDSRQPLPDFSEVPEKRSRRNSRGSKGPGKKSKSQEGKPGRGPIPERRTDRLFDWGDEDEADLIDFDNVATSQRRVDTDGEADKDAESDEGS
ncbi:MAG: hypothetical protein HY645_09860 [Acidobacteria bacterium]|nr:hypothetical protein [Acidobacteriota bacterium]